MHRTCPHLLVLAALGAAACSPAPDAGPLAARDLTLAPAAAPEAVLGPAERIAPPAPGGTLRAPVAAPARRPVVARRAAVSAAPEPAAPAAPVPAPVEEAAAAEPAPIADSWAGAGHTLEPGQAVGVVPVAMGRGTRMPQTDLVSERGIRWAGMVPGEDRCIPGRDEMLPGFRARRN